MSNYIYKRYYIVCGDKYFCRTYISKGVLYAVWGNKFNAKQYRQITKVNAMKEKLEGKEILGEHENAIIKIETIEKETY